MIWLLFALLAYVAALTWRGMSKPWAERVRILRRGLAPIALVYLAIMLMLMFLENALLYHPTKPSNVWMNDPDSTDVNEEVWLKSDDGTKLHAWWYPYPSPQWYVLYSHGNGGNLRDRAWSCALWRKLGAAVLIYDYPGYGQSDGKPSEAGCQAAARAGYDWLRNEKKVPPERLILFGESLGGAMAVELATTRPHHALVLYASFTSVPDMAQSIFPWLPTRWMVRTRYDNLAKIRHYAGPVFIAHGTADSIVPYKHGERLYEAALTPAAMKQLFPVPEHDHNNGLIPDVFEAIAKFLLKLPQDLVINPVPGKP